MNSPVMEVGTVEMVSVEWILKNATYSVDGFCTETEDGWQMDYVDMMSSKLTDYGVPSLIEAIMDEGFRVPIVLDLDYYLNRSSVTHGNGHHRFCVAILLGLEKIPVYWASNDYMGDYGEATNSDNLPETPSIGTDYEAAWESLLSEISEELYS